MSFWFFSKLLRADASIPLRVGGKQSILKKTDYCLLQRFLIFCFAFPDYQDTPPQLLQRPIILPISFNISQKLRIPEPCITGWTRGPFASWVLMPKATVHEDTCVVFWQNNIGVTWQVLPMKAKSKAHRVELPPYSQLWSSILSVYRRHYAGALSRCEFVHEYSD